jgi:hypothetical protein
LIKWSTTYGACRARERSIPWSLEEGGEVVHRPKPGCYWLLILVETWRSFRLYCIWHWTYIWEFPWGVWLSELASLQKKISVDTSHRWSSGHQMLIQLCLLDVRT